MKKTSKNIQKKRSYFYYDENKHMIMTNYLEKVFLY